MSERANLDWYAGGKDVSEYAKEAMAWAVGKEIISGQQGYGLDPQGKTDRAATATMFMRFLTSYNL